MDFVFVKDLAVRTISGVDAWKRPQSQPLAVSVYINSNFRQAGKTDHLKASLNYDVISRNLVQEIESEKFKNLTHVAESVARLVLKQANISDWARIHVKKTRHLLRAESAELVITRQRKLDSIAPTGENSADMVKINDLGLVTVIGVNNIERLHKQNVVINLVMYKPLNADAATEERYDVANISEIVAAHVENATYKTLEAFTESIAHVVISQGVDKVKVSAAKPSALTWAKAAGIEVVRSRDDFDTLLAPEQQQPQTMFPQTLVDTSKPVHTVYLGFGTNIGDKLENIRQAADLLSKAGVKVQRQSSVYKSQPMYVKDQDEFFNGVFACETTLSPIELLDAIKEIEYDQFKRQNLQRNGPRPMDIDILLYDDVVLNTERLNIPHIDMLGRSFVLQPLLDVATPDLIHPLTAEPFGNHLAAIPVSSDNQVSSALSRIVPCPGGFSLEVDPVSHSRPTLIMAILNSTPDSFSDGGVLNAGNCVDIAREHVKNGASILDVGGLSTRPGSSECSAETETERVVSVILKLRSIPDFDNVLISVDTYRSQVAKAALEAGANLINDVFSGQLDKKIFAVARDFKAPVILSHSRGIPSTMNSLNEYSGSLTEAIGKELEQFVGEAMEAGVQRWQIILDPGYGFAKNIHQNLELIRRFKDLRNFGSLKGFAWLVGTSRKRFIGTLTENTNEPSDRDYGTAATTTALIQQGADIVRVHNTKLASDTVKVSDAIYRGLY